MMDLAEFNRLYDDFNKSEIFNIKFMAAVRLFYASTEITEYVDAPNYNILISNIKQFFSLVRKLDVVSLNPLELVTNAVEFHRLWELLGNESAKQEVLQDHDGIKSSLLSKENYDIESYINAVYIIYLRQPKLSTDEQAQLQAVLVALGGGSHQIRIWFSAKIIASFLSPPVGSIISSFQGQHSINLIYFLLYVQIITNKGIEISLLFNLIQFSFLLEAANIKGKSKNKFHYILDLLWYRLSILLWDLTVEQNIKLINDLLGVEGSVDEKIYFFKILALFYYDKIKIKSKFTDQSHAESLDVFLRDSLSLQTAKINQLSFISALFAQDFFADPKSIDGFSVERLFIFYLECCRKKIQNEYLIYKLCGYLEKQSRDLEGLWAEATTAEERLAQYKKTIIDLRSQYSERLKQIRLLTAEHQQSSVTVRQLLITSAELRASVEGTTRRLNDAEQGLQQQLSDLKTKVDGLAVVLDTAVITTSSSFDLDQLRNDFAIAYGAISYANDNHSVFVYHYLNLLFSSYDFLLTRCLHDHFSSTELDVNSFKVKSGFVHVIHTILNYNSFRVEYNAVIGVGDFTKVKFILNKDFPVYSSRISAIVTHMEGIEQQLTVAKHGHVIDIIRFVIQVGKLFSSKSELVCTPKF